ncbi:SxtJ family membrane protein [Prosthecobacter dejongeii]|uniref:SxtJ n=1 Tax=Prosthecobacter dejongeii TaxID=48465 RepID=A0A7W8DRR9_9BACT|nr:SxtJ family membrane protein [Prosthecobacter dejongeii]MBB5039156.1 hypothetical protein [Prosthecobacter dejongeii]
MVRQNIILQELREVEQSPRAWRAFGWVMAAALVVLAGISFWKHGQITLWTLGLGSTAVAFALTGLILPRLLKELHLSWMFISLCLGWVMSRVILILLFVLVVIPTHVAGRVFNLSFMQMRSGAEKDSLWVKRKPRERRHHEKLF